MRALLIAYYFPPIGGGGVQRSLKFARYLPEFGYDVTVITGPGTTVDRWSPADDTLQAEIGHADIRRVSESEPDQTSWQIRREKWLGLHSHWSRWWIDGVVDAGRGLTDGIDVVIASVPPYQTAEAAMALSHELGCPWVADLRDHWAVDELMIYASGLHRRWDLRRMRKMLGTAAAVLAVSPEGARRIRGQVKELTGRPVVSIPNGFDPHDFDDATPERLDGVFRIVHAGSLYTDIGLRQRWKLRRLLGGSTKGVDILPHSLINLLQAIEQLVQRDPSLRSRIELLLVGVVADTDRKLAEQSQVVRMTGYVPHREAIDLMRSADLLFLPMYNLSPGLRAATVPGKAYEYLATQRPILAALPEGDARDMLVQAGNAYICAPDDVDAMAAAIEGQLKGKQVLLAGPVPDKLLERFERRRLTQQLAVVLDAVTGGSRAGLDATRPSAT
jgi:glycosyltransferase involved in cell wall biosynthesis